MIQSILQSAIKKFSTKYNYDASYLNDILGVSMPLFFKFNKFVKLSQYRKKTPLEIYYVAKIAALKVADCGPCLQLTVDFALEKKVSATVLENAVRKTELLTVDQKLAYDFGNAMASNDENHDEVSAKFEERFGKDALVETAIAVATAIVYPTLKRGLRHAKACHLVKVRI